MFLKLNFSVVSLIATRAKLYIPQLIGSLRPSDLRIRKWDATEKLSIRCAVEDLLESLTCLSGKTVQRDRVSTGGLNMVKSS